MASYELPQCTCLIVVGTRPEAIKMVPVIRAIEQSQRINVILVNTGQHQDLVEPVLKAAGITADYTLGVGRPGISLAELTQEVIGGVDAVLTELRGGPERRTQPRLFSGIGRSAGHYPSLILVHGDTTTALAAGMAGFSSRLPVVHVEAGLRSGNRRVPFPEEMNRQLLSRLAALHLAPTIDAAQTLVREGIDMRTIFVTGNTGVDAVLWAAELASPYSEPRLARVDSHDGPVIVATAHRRESWGRGIAGIARGLRTIAEQRPDSLTLLPLHPNPTVRDVLVAELSGLDNVLLTDPLDYLDFARMLRRADLAITDSGGIQEESPSLGTPVLVTREVSERGEGIAAGLIELVGTGSDDISSTALGILADHERYKAMTSAENPFGDGLAARRIARLLEHLVFGTPMPAAFGDTFDRVAALQNAGFDVSEVNATIGWLRGLEISSHPGEVLNSGNTAT